MDVYSGETKEEKPKTGLGDNVRVVKSRLTRIPKRVAQIDAYPARMMDGDVPVTEENAEPTFKEFFGEHRDLFEIEPEDLRLASAKKINNRWYVKYDQYYKGIPVYNATVGLDSSEYGMVGTYAANYHPDIDVPTEPSVSLEDATEIAIKSYPEQDRPKMRREEDTLIIYPVETEEQITYHLVWKLLIVAEVFDPEIEKFVFVDALDGTILWSYNARFPGAQVTGTVKGEIYPANPTDAVSTEPIRNEYVDIEDAGQATTDRSGTYRKTVSWVWQAAHWPSGDADFELRGPYARVRNHNGTNYTETRDCNTSSPCDLTWTAADRDHINVFYHMNLYHDWLRDELGYSWVNHWDGTHRFNAQVNYTFDNAFAGNPMTFGLDVFARSSDVIYHECTHNILCHFYGGYIGWPNNFTEAYAMDEGFADYFACSFTNESRHGEGYTNNPRNLNNNRQYPGKSSFHDEGHTGGTIIGGAAWDLRQRLINLYGATGARIADQLILEAHQILSTYPRNYYFSDPNESNLLTALYKAADIDNNLLNGFPYLNDIQHAFHGHALLQAVLGNRDSFDFSTNMLGTLTGGDLYYSGGKFWANNVNQKGVIDLGNIGNADLSTVNIPTSGYTRFGVSAVSGHTYVSLAQEGEKESHIVFRVTGISADKSNVTIRYFYRFNPWYFVANLNSKEIHRLDCHWVSRMAVKNRSYCDNLQEVADLIEHSGYNGCHYCLPRYDTDTLSLPVVLQHLHEDLQ